MDYDITESPWFGSDEASYALEGVPFGSDRRTKKINNSSCRDRLYYHRILFDGGGFPNVVHKTDKAVLYESSNGRFWVPKALLRENNGLTYVHKSFKIAYLPHKTQPPNTTTKPRTAHPRAS